MALSTFGALLTLVCGLALLSGDAVVAHSGRRRPIVLVVRTEKVVRRLLGAAHPHQVCEARRFLLPDILLGLVVDDEWDVVLRLLSLSASYKERLSRLTVILRVDIAEVIL